MRTLLKVYDEDNNIILDYYWYGGTLRYTTDKDLDWWYYEVYTKGYKQINCEIILKGLSLFQLIEYKKKIRNGF